VKRFRNPGILLLLLIPLVAISLLGIAPRPHALTQLLQQASRAQELGQSSKSAEVMARALAAAAEYMPWQDALWEQAGRYALQAGDPQAAIRYLEHASAIKSLSSSGRTLLGDAYQQAGDNPAAKRAWTAALQAGSPPEEIYTRLLEVHRRLKDYAGAIQDLQALTSLEPTNAGLRYQLGLLLAAQQPEAALPYLAQAGSLDPSYSASADALSSSIRIASLKSDKAYLLLESGRALGDIDQWNLASEAFHQSILARPDYAEAWAFLGEAMQHQAQGDPARDGLLELGRALQLDPRSLSAHLFMAFYWQRHGRLDLALDYLKNAATLYPEDPQVQTALGDSLALNGDLPAAFGAYQQAIKLAPNDSTYYRLLAEFSLEHEYEVRTIALPAARQALALAPEDPATLDTLGQVFFLLEDFTSAERYFERALQADERYAPSQLHLGLIYLMNGDRSAAFDKFNLAQTLAPGTATAEHAQRLLQNNFP
jgi:tetratricopeptide (TPR) repeat protein